MPSECLTQVQVTIRMTKPERRALISGDMRDGNQHILAQNTCRKG
jgi:hypothetical protein